MAVEIESQAETKEKAMESGDLGGGGVERRRTTAGASGSEQLPVTISEMVGEDEVVMSRDGRQPYRSWDFVLPGTSDRYQTPKKTRVPAQKCMFSYRSRGLLLPGITDRYERFQFGPVLLFQP